MVKRWPGAEIAELTGLLPPRMLAKWPDGMRVIVRRERPHPGAQLSMFEELDGWRYQAFVTNTATGQLQYVTINLAMLRLQHFNRIVTTIARINIDGT